MSIEMSAEMDFFIFLLEHYAHQKNRSADQILNTWDEIGITQYVFDMYELYHSERLENAYDDIERKISQLERAN